jgi:hypothetical protein
VRRHRKLHCARPGAARPAAQLSNQTEGCRNAQAKTAASSCKVAGLHARSAARCTSSIIAAWVRPGWVGVSQARVLQRVLRETGKLQTMMLHHPPSQRPGRGFHAPCSEYMFYLAPQRSALARESVFLSLLIFFADPPGRSTCLFPGVSGLGDGGLRRHAGGVDGEPSNNWRVARRPGGGKLRLIPPAQVAASCDGGCFTDVLQPLSIRHHIRCTSRKGLRGRKRVSGQCSRSIDHAMCPRGRSAPGAAPAEQPDGPLPPRSQSAALTGT